MSNPTNKHAVLAARLEAERVAKLQATMTLMRPGLALERQRQAAAKEKKRTNRNVGTCVPGPTE